MIFLKELSAQLTDKEREYLIRLAEVEKATGQNIKNIAPGKTELGRLLESRGVLVSVKPIFEGDERINYALTKFGREYLDVIGGIC